MRVLVIGGGGREHAILWKLTQSPMVEKIYCIPGNGGMAELAKCVPGDISDIDFLVDFAKKYAIDFTVVGPELPLALGVVDAFQRENLRIFGPSGEAAQLESSKAYAKAFMERYGIPTARYRDCLSPEQAFSALEEFNYPLVVKADGLAAGKGVIIAQGSREARECITEMMMDGIFGNAGKRVIIEEFLEGREVSLLAFIDKDTLVPMITAQDYKKALDGDRGLNTGGMGAITPSPIESGELLERISKEIMIPTFEGIQREGLEYRGVIYFGLMITREGPKLLEYNVRFGDPETQAILPRLESDLLEIMLGVTQDQLSQQDIRWKPGAAITVALTSGGYPRDYEKGKPITGLDRVKDVVAFHSGTSRKQGVYYTDGGRVLTVTALDENLERAAQRVYQQIRHIHFEGMHYRRDIGGR